MANSWNTEDDDVASNDYGFDWESIAISALKIFAWIDLIVGIGFGILILAKYAKSEGVVATGVGIAIFLQGVFVWALFLVIASIAQNLIAIKENTKPQKFKS